MGKTHYLSLAYLILSLCSCEELGSLNLEDNSMELGIDSDTTQLDGWQLSLSMFDYEGQQVPAYITKDNTSGNVVTNEGAMLGRVLFYDKNLSSDRTIACASCHEQSKGFGDDQVQSQGVNGLTGRHSMRLINSRFSNEVKFFWDERAASLEDQTTKPIQDHSEMGFSGTNGDPGFGDLIERLDSVEFYGALFTQAFGDTEITEEKIQDALAQFIRSIQSFDSKYDQGMERVDDERMAFPNYSPLENDGKRLFMMPPPQGGAGCAGCHRPPEFDIDPLTGNNGIITSLTKDQDITNTRAPSLRGLFDDTGKLLGPLMHDGSKKSLEEVVAHYNNIPQGVEGIDRRLDGQQLNLTDEEVTALVAFIKTLSGSKVLTDERWSDPF
ncbi:cytochrome-c peroxidase [Marinoscillum sp. MHG1-6]|uniref:cytochrome-c peroxidase n=1 Tax=Marinoscillum sp. MHG1-6 TaxID=2959627 RepID=UPI0021578181|nr:cytochrome-c peroxidase [Marinoscillum sp. MHG1-6]